jgi:hypothetical protein
MGALNELSRQLGERVGQPRARRLYVTPGQRVELADDARTTLPDGCRLMGMEVIVDPEPEVARTLDTLDWTVSQNNSTFTYSVVGRLGAMEARRVVTDAIGLRQTEVQWAIKDAARHVARIFVERWWDQVERAPTKDVRFYHSTVWSQPTRVTYGGRGGRRPSYHHVYTAPSPRQDFRVWVDEAASIDPYAWVRPEFNWHVTPALPDPERQRPASQDQADRALDAGYWLFPTDGSTSGGSNPSGSGG